MKKINFVFGIHSHQPVGNFDFVFEDAYQKAYQPFLNIIEEFPDFRLNIHYSGILWDWIEKHHPEHIDQMRRLVSAGQVELMSGGFFEPILAVIPEKNAVDQIQMLTDWINDRFGQVPKGMWLAERVWEPTLPGIMSQANILYTVIDDAHFKYAGLKPEQLLGYYTTEDRGELVYIFPISQKLRYTIPFQKPEVTIEYLRELATESGDKLIVFADDGEKFGVWPGTYSHVYERNWLRDFIKLLLENRDWINILHFSEAIERLDPAGRIYLPTASYAEMMHWALPVQAYREYEDFEQYLKREGIYDRVSVFVRGGFWRNFLSKYPESNNMHKKALYLSQQVRGAMATQNDAHFTQALKHIFAAECNCPYWHGVFGGLYLGHIRHAIYQHLIQAEKLLRKGMGTDHDASIQVLDFDQDGLYEVLMETPKLNLYFDLQQGGHLFELDYLPANFNLLNTMTRREEGYHRKLLEMSEHKLASEVEATSEGEIASIHDLVLVKEKGLEKYLIYDSYERKSLIDHFFSPDIRLEAFQQNRYSELGNFVGMPYQLQEHEVRADASSLCLLREGRVQLDGENLPLRLEKRVRVDHREARVEIRYRLQPLKAVNETVLFAVEFNFSLLAGDAPDRYYYSREVEIQPNRLVSVGELRDVHHVGLVDEYNRFKVDLTSDREARIWYLPVETVSLSEAGFERVYQNSAILFLFPVELNQTFEVKLDKKIVNL
ncbi:MAG: DUF1926 domain-containing protein [Calditrichaeota bacterium]|nr:DUF1926 domain-containing protein [Calditrichota bacterium]